MSNNNSMGAAIMDLEQEQAQEIARKYLRDPAEFQKALNSKKTPDDVVNFAHMVLIDLKDPVMACEAILCGVSQFSLHETKEAESFYTSALDVATKSADLALEQKHDELREKFIMPIIEGLCRGLAYHTNQAQELIPVTPVMKQPPRPVEKQGGPNGTNGTAAKFPQARL